MKIFLDTADIKSIHELIPTGLIDGVTTNPTHLAQQKKKPLALIKEICQALPDGVISVEVTDSKPEEVYRQAKKIAAIADNIVVKIPCHALYYPVIDRLVYDEIPLNITLVFSLIQSLAMCKLGVDYISPFVGRLDDIDSDGSSVLEDIRYMIDEYGYDTQILAASIRSVRHFHEAIMIGADAVTVPVSVFKKACVHPLTDKGIERFNEDWKKLGIKKFP